MRRTLVSVTVAIACLSMLASCALLPLTNDQRADAELRLIQVAVKHHDAAALKKLFSKTARAKAPNLDDGIDDFFDLFPSGFESLGEPAGGVGETDINKSGKKTVELYGNYKVKANGEAYNLFFADVIVNQIGDPNTVGLYALGAAPYNPEPGTSPTPASKAFFAWENQFGLPNDAEVSGTPSVYVYSPKR